MEVSVMRRDWVKSRIWKACGVVLSLCMIVGSVNVALTHSGSEGVFSDVVAAADTEEHIHKVCNGIDYYGHEGASCTEHNDVTWTAWTYSTSMPTQNGNYYLTTDVKLTKEWTLPTGPVSLCLNGHTITSNTEAYIINAKNNSTTNSFSLTDCKGTGKITSTSESGNFLYFQQSAFFMYGGTITGIKCYLSPVTALDGFFMYGGSITGNTSHCGGGVNVRGTFAMFGGSITNNEASMKDYNVSGGQTNYGGGVYANGKVYLYGGTIANNRADCGGGIYGGSPMYIYAGFSLTGNSADSKYGGIYSGGPYYISGGIVKDNTAGTENSNLYVYDTANYILGELSDATDIWVTARGYAYATKPKVLFTGNASKPEYTVVEADSEKIHSDNSEYNVAYDAENAVIELTSTVPFAGDRSTYSFSYTKNTDNSDLVWYAPEKNSVESSLVSSDDKEKGDTIAAALTITNDSNLNAAQSDLLEKAMGYDGTTAVIGSARVSIEVTDTTYLGEKTVKFPVRLPYSSLTYSVKLPENVRNGSNYHVYYLDESGGGGANSLTVSDSGYTKITTMNLGMFVIAYTPAAVEQETTTAAAEKETSATTEPTTAASTEGTTTAAAAESTTAAQTTTTTAAQTTTTTAAQTTTTTAAQTTAAQTTSATNGTTSSATGGTKIQTTSATSGTTSGTTARTTMAQTISAANRTSVQTTAAAAGILTADDIPGASVVQIDNTDFAQMGASSESTEKITDMTGSTGTVPDSVQVAAGTENVNEAVLNDIANDSNDTISVLASESAAISAQVINALKDSGKTLSVGIVGDSGKVNAIVTLDSDKLTNATRDFSLKIVTDVVSESVAKAANSRGISSESYDVIDFSYSGVLPGAFKISVNVADRFTDGTRLALYYNNQTTGQLENQYQLTTVSDGYAEFTIDHCSQYVLVSVDAVGSSIVESTISSPKTGDTAKIIFWLMLMAVAVFVGFGLQAVKADKNCK
jgi:hypothetical protein